jgi:hypothetical protein
MSLIGNFAKQLLTSFYLLLSSHHVSCVYGKAQNAFLIGSKNITDPALNKMLVNH